MLETAALKTATRRATQKLAEITSDLIDNEIANTITCKSNKSENVEMQPLKLIKKYAYP